MAVEITDSAAAHEPFARTEQLFSLMDAKRMLLAELRGLSVSQAEAIDKQDVSELLALLARKQAMMDRLMIVQQQMLSFQGEDPETRVWSNPERRRACQEIKRLCDQWIQEILVMEQRATESMTAQRDTIAGHLLQSADSMRLARAYGFDEANASDADESLSLDG
ncbi:MAG: hypothetical protein ACK6DC_11725 [Planctomycetota bacterium]